VYVYNVKHNYIYDKPINLQDNKQELITKYRKVYSEFIESIYFDHLQQGD